MKFSSNKDRQDSINRVMESSKRELHEIDNSLQAVLKEFPDVTCIFHKVYFNPESETFISVGLFEYYGMEFCWRDEKTCLRDFTGREHFIDAIAGYRAMLNRDKFKLRPKRLQDMDEEYYGGVPEAAQEPYHHVVERMRPVRPTRPAIEAEEAPTHREPIINVGYTNNALPQGTILTQRAWDEALDYRLTATYAATRPTGAGNTFNQNPA